MSNPVLRKCGCLMALSLLTPFGLAADNPEVPCMVFSGNSETTVNIDVTRYNRINFHETSFLVTPPEGKEGEDLWLDYSDYNRVAFRNAVPSDLSETEEIQVEAEKSIFYSSAERMLRCNFPDGTEAALRVMNAEGRTVLATTLSASRPAYLGNLMPGIYIATADEDGARHTIKFILE